MKMLKSTATLALLLLAVTSLQAAHVTAVKVQDRPDRVEVIASLDATATFKAHQPASGRWVSLDIRAAFGAKPVVQTFKSSAVMTVKAGWFKSTPPTTRIVVSTRSRVPYQVLKADASGLKLVVFKSVAAAKAAKAPATAKAPVAPAPKPALIASTQPILAAPATRVAGVKEEISTKTVKVGQLLSPKAARSLETRVAKAPDIQPLEPAANIVSLNFVGTDINDVLKALTMQAGVNIVTATDVKGEVTVALQDVDFETALNSITRLSGFRWTNDGRTYYVATDKSLGSFSSSTSEATTEVISFARLNSNDLVALLKTELPAVSATIPGDTAASKQIILQGSKNQVDAAKLFVQRIDGLMTPVARDIVTEVYSIKYALASSLITILNRVAPTVSVAPGAILSPLKLLPPDDKKGLLYTVGEDESSDSGSGPATGNTSAGSDPANAGPASGAASASDKKLADRARTLILSGLPGDIEQARAVLSRVDVKPPQVLIEAKVVDMVVTDSSELGIQYNQDANGFTFGVVPNRVQHPNYPGTFSRGVHGVSELTLLLDASIRAEVVKGNAQILANPKLSVLEGQPATIFIGDKIKYIETIQATTSGITVTTGEVNAGIELGCLPLVSVEDGSITLQIHPEASTPELITDKQTGVTLPQVATRFTDTTIRVLDGETIVIGGLISTDERQTLTKIPFLGDLPFLGQLFRHKSKEMSKRELMIFITCRIMKEDPA